MEYEGKFKQFGKSMNTASLLTSSRTSLPDLFIAAEPTNPRGRDSGAGLPADTKQGKRPRVAIHGPGSLARHHAPETHEQGEVLGRVPSALPRSNSVKLGYYQWKKKHPWSYPRPKLVMKSIIQEKYQQLEELRERAQRLERDNLLLVEEIKDTDKQMDLDARMLLEKHDQFLNKLAQLKQGYEDRVDLARQATEKNTNTLSVDLDRLEIKLEDEEKSVKLEQQHLSVLISYQQKEYPLKAMEIYELKDQEARIGVIYEQEVRELNGSIEEEKERMRQRENRRKINIYQKITDIAIKNTPDQVVAQLRENKLLREEIKSHQSHISRLTGEVDSLSSNVLAIKRRWRETEQEKIDKAKPSDDADLEINGDSLEFPRQPIHIIL